MASKWLGCSKFMLLMILFSGVSSYLTQNELNGLIDKTNLRIGDLSSSPLSSTMLDLIGANNFSVSDANFTSIRNAVNVSGGKFLFDRLTFMEMTSYLNITQDEGENMTVAKLLQSVDAKLMVGIRISKQPVAFAAFMKNFLLPQVLPMYLIDLGVRVTGFTEPIIRKLYNMSDVDFGNAQVLPFGGLPAYVNLTMNVLFDIKQFNTLSLDSLTRAMLVHKNHTEGTIDFIKDFGFIARHVSIGTIKTIYNINSAMFNSSSLFTLSNLISGINYIQLQMVLHDRSALNLKGATIGEMADYLKLNASELDKLSIAGLRDKFNLSVSASIALSLQPVAIAAYAKGIAVNQIVLMNVIDLGVRVTGFTEPIIRKLYNMSDVDFGNAQVLPFGGLPAYVNLTMNVLFDIKQFNTLSLDSLTRAMLVHKNHTEGTIDFIKDFRFIARNVSIGKIKLVYNMNTAILNSSSLFTLSNLISGITYVQLQMVLHDRSALNLKGVTIGEMADYLKLNVSALDKLSIAGLRDKFSLSVSASIALSLQPVAVAAYKKGIMLNQIAIIGVVDLAARVTGFTVPLIQKVYNISDVDFGNAMRLMFGGIPEYVLRSIGVQFQLKHFYVMSLKSIYNAFIIHKNIVLGTIDFRKDFNVLASSMSIRDLSKIFFFNIQLIKQKTIPEFLDLIAGTNITVVFNYNVQETAAISSFTFEEGLYFLRSRARELQLDRMPLNHFIGAIIEQFKVVPQLFVPLDTLAIGNLMQISILQLTKLGNLTQPGLHRLLNSSFISVRYFERIKGLTLGEAFAKGIFSIATENVGRRTLKKFLQSIRGVKVFARLPFLVAAYYNGFGSASLSERNIATTIHNVLGFDVLTVSTQLNLQANLSAATLSAFTFRTLGTRLSQLFGRVVSYKQLYHISVYSLLDAVLIRNSTQDMIRAVDEAIRFISLRMKLHEVGSMYHIRQQDLLNNSLVSLLTAQSDVQGSEVAKALNMSLVQEQLLNRVRIVDAQILLGMRSEIFDLTTERIGHRIINLNAEIIAFFTPLEDLLKARNISLAGLHQLKFPNFLSSVLSTNIDQILKRMNISKLSQAFIFRKTIAEIAAAKNIQLLSFAKWHIFRIFWDLKMMISIGSDACKKFATPCVANADCYDPPQHIFCRCKDGFSGNSTYCYDGCTNKQCPSGSTCSNVPGGSVVCRCTKPGYALKNNKCARQSGRIFKVSGLKYNQAYKDTYKDTNSQSFKQKAAEIETILFRIIRKLIIGCIGIRVTSIRRGSIVVDYSVIIDEQYQNVTDATVLDASKKSLNDEEMLALGVNTSSTLSAQASNVCEIGGSDCDVNSKCIANSDGVSYTCKCNDGYKQDGNKCSKDDDDHTGIIIGVVVAVVVIIILVVLLVLYKKYQKTSKRANSVPFSLFRKSSQSSTVGVDNKSYETKTV